MSGISKSLRPEGAFFMPDPALNGRILAEFIIRRGGDEEAMLTASQAVHGFARAVMVGNGLPDPVALDYAERLTNAVAKRWIELTNLTSDVGGHA